MHPQQSVKPKPLPVRSKQRDFLFLTFVFDCDFQRKSNWKGLQIPALLPVWYGASVHLLRERSNPFDLHNHRIILCDYTRFMALRQQKTKLDHKILKESRFFFAENEKLAENIIHDNHDHIGKELHQLVVDPQKIDPNIHAEQVQQECCPAAHEEFRHFG